MFPGIVLYLSGFYTRKELSLRCVIIIKLKSALTNIGSLLSELRFSSRLHLWLVHSLVYLPQLS